LIRSSSAGLKDHVVRTKGPEYLHGLRRTCAYDRSSLEKLGTSFEAPAFGTCQDTLLRIISLIRKALHLFAGFSMKAWLYNIQRKDCLGGVGDLAGKSSVELPASLPSTARNSHPSGS
jgi:hypothetical protein